MRSNTNIVKNDAFIPSADERMLSRRKKNDYPLHKISHQDFNIELQNVSRYWANKSALKGINMGFSQGETIALIGPSGGGKSTLLRLLAGVLRPSSGDVYVNDDNLEKIPLKKLRVHRSRCGIIHQNHLLVPQLSVHQNIISGMIASWPMHKIAYASFWPLEKKRIAQLLATLNIAELQWERASNLSGGQQQRVAIARALVNRPNIILADEPTASLDPTSAKEATQLIIQYAKQRNALLIICTHQLNAVKNHCDRIVGLRNGECLFDVPQSKLKQQQVDQLYVGSRDRV